MADSCLAEAINKTSRSKVYGTPKERFLKGCYPLEGGCVGFRGHHDKDGYPRFTFAGRSRPGTHAAFACVGVSVPHGLQVNHHCDNRKCVNPDHLFIGTQDDNVKDMMEKDRHALGERHTISLLTDDAVRDIRANCRRGVAPAHLFAAKYGVSQSTIYAAKCRQNWKHVA